MKKLFYILLIQVSSLSLFSQTNLILNGGFENDFQHWSTKDNNFLFISGRPWPDNEINWCTPDVANCSSSSTTNHRSIEPSTNYFGVQFPYEGNRYVGFMTHGRLNGGTNGFGNGKIGYHLSSPLVKDKFYILKFRVSKMDNSVNNPKLKIILNDAFTDPLIGKQVIYSKTKTEDGSPSNQTWEEVSILFPVLDDGFDWLVFKNSNDFILKPSWAGVYLDDIQLYEWCDYYSVTSTNSCLVSAIGLSDINAGPLSTSGPLYHWSAFPEQFHISHITGYTYIKVVISAGNSNPIRTIEKRSNNGFLEGGIWWDGKTDSGAEAAAAWYVATVDAWKGFSNFPLPVLDCNHVTKTFNFIKLNGTTDDTDPIDALYPLNDNDYVWDAPIQYQFCCLSDITVNNAHFTSNDILGTGNTPFSQYAANNKIIFGPNVITDNNTTVILIAPQVINLTAPLNIHGNLFTNLTNCVFRKSNPLFNSGVDTIFTDFNFTEFKLFPNPTTIGGTTLNLGSSMVFDINEIDLNIYNIFGSKILFNYFKGVNSIKIELGNNPLGIYILQIKYKNSYKNIKLICH